MPHPQPFLDSFSTATGSTQNYGYTNQAPYNANALNCEDESDNRGEGGKGYRQHKVSSMKDDDAVRNGRFYCTGRNPRTQALCKKSFTSARERKKHFKCHSQPYECLACPTRMASRNDIKKHLETHRPSSERDFYPCPYCEQEFTREDNMLKHVNNFHVNSQA